MNLLHTLVINNFSLLSLLLVYLLWLLHLSENVFLWDVLIQYFLDFFTVEGSWNFRCSIRALFIADVGVKSFNVDQVFVIDASLRVGRCKKKSCKNSPTTNLFAKGEAKPRLLLLLLKRILTLGGRIGSVCTSHPVAPGLNPVSTRTHFSSGVNVRALANAVSGEVLKISTTATKKLATPLLGDFFVTHCIFIWSC